VQTFDKALLNSIFIHKNGLRNGGRSYFKFCRNSHLSQVPVHTLNLANLSKTVAKPIRNDLNEDV